MITSSSEDIDKLQKTISIINFLKAMISNNQTAFIQINGVEKEVMPVITSDEINELDSYYSNMYNFLRNPGMTEEEYTSYEQSKD